jgi:hypothetical protein
LAVHDHPWRIMVPLCSRPWADLALTSPRAARMTETHNGSKNDGTIAWNPLGFHLVEALPKGRIVNAEYNRDNILPPPSHFSQCPASDNLSFMQTMQGPQCSTMSNLLSRKWAATRYTSARFTGSHTVGFLPLWTRQEPLARNYLSIT